MSLYLPLFFSISGTLTWKISISRFLTKELPFTFLVVQIYWQWIPSAFACWNSFYFVSLLKATFLLYSILDWLFFFFFIPYFNVATLLSYGLHSFCQEIFYKSHLCSFVPNTLLSSFLPPLPLQYSSLVAQQ